MDVILPPLVVIDVLPPIDLSDGGEVADVNEVIGGRLVDAMLLLPPLPALPPPRDVTGEVKNGKDLVPPADDRLFISF